jgi:hypothetical protein
VRYHGTISRRASDCKVDGTPTSKPMTVKPESQVGQIVDTIPESVCEKKSCTVGIGGGD